MLHSAQLHETKTARYTYVVEDGQYGFGSLVQRSSGRFQNFILDEDTHRTEIGKDSALSSIQTPIRRMRKHTIDMSLPAG